MPTPVSETSLSDFGTQEFRWPPHLRDFVSRQPQASAELFVFLSELGRDRALEAPPVPPDATFAFVWKHPSPGRALPLIVPIDRIDELPHHGTSIALSIDPRMHELLLALLSDQRDLTEANAASHCLGSCFLCGWHLIRPGCPVQ